MSTLHCILNLSKRLRFQLQHKSWDLVEKRPGIMKDENGQKNENGLWVPQVETSDGNK